MPSSLPVIECRGDPRAMGQAQGTAFRSEIRARADALGIAHRGRLPFSLRPLLAGRALGAGMGREIVRHYPHLGERIQGLARGSGLAIDTLMELFVRESRGDAPEDALTAEASVAARAGEAARVARSLPDSGRAGWTARRSAPEVGFASVEITLPWLACSIGGVNEGGVAAAVVSHPQAKPSDAPSALLLVQEFLQRFDDVTGCVDWALKRPVSGSARLVAADATGRVVAIEIDGDQQTVHEVVGETDGKLDSDLVLDPHARSLQLRLPGREALTLSV